MVAAVWFDHLTVVAVAHGCGGEGKVKAVTHTFTEETHTHTHNTTVTHTFTAVTHILTEQALINFLIDRITQHTRPETTALSQTRHSTPVAGHRLSMKYERYDFSQWFLANLTMRNKTRVLSFTVTRANFEILPRPFSAHPAHLYLSF